MYEAWNSCDRGYLDGEYEDTGPLVGMIKTSHSRESGGGGAAVPEQAGGAHDLVNGAGSVLIV